MPTSDQDNNNNEETGNISVDISISGQGVILHINDKQVYRSVNQTIQWGSVNKRHHAGLHLVTLHQTTGHVMTTSTFTTWQVTQDTAFIHTLQQIQDGRLILILGVPDFTTHLGEATSTLRMLGSQYGDKLAYLDIWCLVLHKGGRVIIEAVNTYLPTKRKSSTDLDVSPLTLHLSVPSVPEPWCSWYGDFEEHGKFCREYDGYGELCRCWQSPWLPQMSQPSPAVHQHEVIPVALLTTIGRLPQVVHQVDKLRSGAIGATTPITLFVDDVNNNEAEVLAKLINVNITFNTNNPSPRGTNSRIHNHYKFVLTNVFHLNPYIDKAIILEDDLALAPDFIEYFHQTAELLTSDPRLLCVNAYNYNAYPHTAMDPTRLYRVNGFPACGWMVRRKVAQEMIDKWPPSDMNVEWDMWILGKVLNGREVLIPEVPRTKHMGGGGSHISGMEQILYHGIRTLNNQTNVTIDIKRAESTVYLKTHLNNIHSGKVIRLTEHPCKVLPLPTTQVNTSFVIYLYQPDGTYNSSLSYYVIARCLGLSDHNYHESLKMMITVPFYGNQLYLIGCPNSPFCVTNDESDVYHASQEDVQFALKNPFRRIVIKKHFALRVPHDSISELINLENLADIYINQA